MLAFFPSYFGLPFFLTRRISLLLFPLPQYSFSLSPNEYQAWSHNDKRRNGLCRNSSRSRGWIDLANGGAVVTGVPSSGNHKVQAGFMLRSGTIADFRPEAKAKMKSHNMPEPLV
jgi:hypothetical protein